MKAISTAMNTVHARGDSWRSRELSVSLRGSLASTFMHAFVCELLDSDHPDILQVVDGALLVIGLASERGHFLPDW
jgi:hypothetical protein